MQQNLKMEANLQKITLFHGLTEQEIEHFINCSKAKKVSLKKGEELYSQEEKINKVAIVIQGELLVYRIDYWGRRDILSVVEKNNIFGAGYAFSPNNKIPVSVSAGSDCQVILIDSNNLVTPCPKACSIHQIIILNLIKILAKRNVILLDKIRNISHRTTKEKILSLISSYAINGVAIIPYDRQAMADYLCVDRASLSRELSKLQQEKIIKFKKNNFILLQDDL